MKIKTKILTIGLVLVLNLSLTSFVHALNFYLSPQETTVDIGEVFSVDIGFNNDGDVLHNGVVVTFSYDENYLELQDTDAGNMTGTGSGPDGINIMDANHFSNWNTDLEMIANQQEDYMSSHPYAIHYDVMHTSNAARDGVFGRVFFKAMQLTPSPTNLVFGSYYGEDEAVYINPGYDEVAVTGNVGASVNVIPEPRSFILFGIGISLMSVIGFIRRSKV